MALVGGGSQSGRNAKDSNASQVRWEGQASSSSADARFQQAIDLQETFERALASERVLLREEFEGQKAEIYAGIEAKKAELKDFFDKRQAELKEQQESFREAQEDAIRAAEALQQVETQLEVQRQEGSQHLEDIRSSLKDLLDAVRGVCLKNLCMGTTIIGVHLFILFQANKRDRR